jgi:hypothetical protein
MYAKSLALRAKIRRSAAAVNRWIRHYKNDYATFGIAVLHNAEG